LYAGVGVKEYFIFDPERKYLKPPFQGFRRVNGKAVPMKPAKDGSLVSKELGVRLVPEGDLLRVIDLATGQTVPTRAEPAEQKKMRADSLAAEIERLRRQLGEP
jgi:hypothetical protein